MLMRRWETVQLPQHRRFDVQRGRSCMHSRFLAAHPVIWKQIVERATETRHGAKILDKQKRQHLRVNSKSASGRHKYTDGASRSSHVLRHNSFCCSVRCSRWVNKRCRLCRLERPVSFFFWSPVCEQAGSLQADTGVHGVAAHGACSLWYDQLVAAMNCTGCAARARLCPEMMDGQPNSRAVISSIMTVPFMAVNLCWQNNL
jgi:hypothetical protein